ncbi:MAG: hypothetical protein JWP89_6986 [Schlesneria sp.]|nr:hypothetical protein [Schlesneria sp.]
MRDFFYGWRRKAGCVMLGIALLFMGVWIRSRYIMETLTYISDEGRHSFSITPNGLEWARRTGSGQYLSPQFMNLSWETIELDDSDFESFPEPSMGWETSWNYRWCGFRSGKFQLTAGGPGLSILYGELARWAIPHWAMVIPLTLLSAYLILRKPRMKSQA